MPSSPCRYLVLGGAGFLGSHVVEALQAGGGRVRVFDRLPRSAVAGAWIDHHTEWYEGDFGNRGEVAAAIEGCDVVFHLVATTLPKTSNEDPVHDLESNLLPTVRFLDVARDNGVRKVVFASSGGTVYGIPEAVPILETAPTRPICSYGIQKLAIEQYLHLYYSLHGLEYCVLRISNAFGERQRPDASQGAVAVFLDQALRGEEITVWGDGTAVRDYVHVGDIARAFCLAAAHTDPACVFNIGSGEGRSIQQLLEAIEELLGRNVRRRYVARRPFDVPVNVLDTTLAARRLGWSAQVGFAEGLRRTLNYLRDAK